MKVWSFAVDLVVTVAALFQILDYWGIRPGDRSAPLLLGRKWKLAIMLGLMAVSLGLSGYGFYRSLRPKIVEKTITVEKIVEKVVPQNCPQPPAPTKPKKSSAAKAANPPTVSTSGSDSPGVGSINQGAGSIAQVGGSGNQATVNNLEKPVPNIIGLTTTEALPASPHPGVSLKFWIDSSFYDPTFLAECDRPCESKRGGTEGAYQSPEFENKKTLRPNVVAMHFIMPATIQGGRSLTWEVRSMDDQPIKILRLWAFRLP
jgi:hypothetical protein